MTAPVNDTLAAATALTGGTVVHVANISSATTDPGEPTANGFPIRNTVWFSWVAPADGSYLFSTVGSNYDTVLGVYTGPPGATNYTQLTFLAVNDDSGGGGTSLMTLTLTAGQTLYLQAGSYNAAPPAAALTLNYPDPGGPPPPPPPAPPPQVVGWADEIDGATVVTVLTPPIEFSDSALDISQNPPVEMALSLHGALGIVEVIDDPDPDEGALPAGQFTASGRMGASGGFGGTKARTIPQVWLDVPAPVLAGGKPVLPRYRGYVGGTASAVQGPAHIHAISDPNPKFDGSGYVYPPPNPPWSARWTVDDLPDPGGGYYWLGAPSSEDGTSGISSDKQQWRANSDRGGPSWHSAYPFKPSVRGYDAYLPGGAVVHHPKGVSFNPHFLEHMWLDFGTDQGQPFSWIVTGMVTAQPSRTYIHHILDAGLSPSENGFSSFSASDCNRVHNFDEGLPYRNLLAYGDQGQWISSRPISHGSGGQLRVRADVALKPRMFYLVFNGTRSIVGALGPGTDRVARGKIDSDSTWHKRYVLGRMQNRLSQGTTAHMLLFELRYWHNKALSDSEVRTQYKQLSSTYNFGRYRTL